MESAATVVHDKVDDFVGHMHMSPSADSGMFFVALKEFYGIIVYRSWYCRQFDDRFGQQFAACSWLHAWHFTRWTYLRTTRAINSTRAGKLAYFVILKTWQRSVKIQQTYLTKRSWRFLWLYVRILDCNVANCGRCWRLSRWRLSRHSHVATAYCWTWQIWRYRIAKI